LMIKLISNLMDEIRSKLLPYQIDHTDQIIKSLKSHNRCLDASDTGTGKTYTAIAVCA
jgi:superfamily II DNA or RNA helicase